MDRNISDLNFVDTNFGNYSPQKKCIGISEEQAQIDKELSLEGIDFEEPFFIDEKENTSKENVSNKYRDENNSIDEYKKRLMNIKSNTLCHTSKPDKISVLNLDSKSTTLSQWSKGQFLLNGSPVKVFKFIILREIT